MMQSKVFGRTGDDLSILGYGCMRFPTKNGRTDLERTEKQILSAIDQGVNYFDTAYIYPGSETALGTILERNRLRDKVKIATKIPPYLAPDRSAMEKILKTQLTRLKTDHLDYYLVHALGDFASWEKAKKSGMVEFLNDIKDRGIINHTGFSYHGEKNDFIKILDDYPWDFCQIQYNYIDEYTQAGRDGLQYAHGKGVGVVIMEPLRGGSLTGRMPESIKSIWDSASIKRSYADWALRWLWDQPEVGVVLSGMNVEAHIEENIRLASEVKPNSLTEEELKLFSRVRETFMSLNKVSCTGCGYCMPCPKGVNIPISFSYYNGWQLFKDQSQRFQYLLMASDATGTGNNLASSCVGCGKCEKHCPQHLPIREHLKEVQKHMEPWWSKPVIGTARMGLKIMNAIRKK